MTLEITGMNRSASKEVTGSREGLPDHTPWFSTPEQTGAFTPKQLEWTLLELS